METAGDGMKFFGDGRVGRVGVRGSRSIGAALGDGRAEFLVGGVGS